MHIGNSRLTVAAMITLMVICADGYGAYQLVWSDEFNGTSLNMSNWSYQMTGDGTYADGEIMNLQYYRSQNTSVSGGI